MSYNVSTLEVTVIAVLAVWELIWKGLALWRAARHHQQAWFIVILVINSAGLLPIIYLLLTRDRPAPQSG